jgi:uncharacterized protein YdeI (YjbR/CyaY-like superfamily)
MAKLPPYIAEGLKATTRANECFEQLALSCQREYISWIDSAKREETKQRRLREAIKMLTSGKKVRQK